MTGRHGLAISLAQYALDLKEGHSHRHATEPGRCDRCREENGTGVWIHLHGEVHCPACVPRERRCSRCERLQPLGHYSVNRKRMNLDTLCGECRRAKGREQYAKAQTREREIATTGTCSVCGEVKGRAAFYVDKRYASGLSSDCRKCHNSANAEYQRAHPRGRG